MRRMASSSPRHTDRRPRRGWSYSLRALLIFFTLVCVGVWYWYRVPYREEIAYAPRKMVLIPEQQYDFWPAKEVRHFRRVLRGEPIREGLTEFFDAAGNRIGREHWREGQLHGEFQRWYPSGQIHERGAYRLGRKTGTWELFELPGQLAARTKFEQNFPHGDAQWFESGKVARTIRYDHGEVTQIDGRPVDDPLGRASRLGQIADRHLYEALSKPAEVDFVETPLKDVADYVSDVYKINVSLNITPLADANISPDSPIDLRARHLNAGTMLVLICEPHGMAATYRWGTIWITTKDDAKNWVDRTGLTDLLNFPPPDASQHDRDMVRAALEKPAQFDFIDTPLQDVAQFLSDTYRVEFSIGEEFSEIKNVPTNSSLRGVALRDALGAVCDHQRLRIRWKDGKKLVFELQDGAE